ncbi:ATP-binding protein [Streptomyces aidingensis]|uniref:Anti-sigma regulatory factor (Ser/Thr protein kinase) n=1 Tax=Streptomyces aidingensis TaxID=910347 RepID=A0A1I1KKX2_9ACTN|nr:ATP-binding protein [Streptomyces aidingensis]SFC60922.1 Anti-sigma regulatory factor (Ser/Thr protein kinase) [Streptomyces aidingensis]
MATVELRFSASPEHVRTARLVAAAVARRAGVEESVLDELRLAVGEACSRAVGLHAAHALDTPVRVTLSEGEKAFSIEVGDDAPPPGGQRAEGPGDGEADQLGLAVIRGLVDDVQVTSDARGGLIRMSWPAKPPSLA